MLNFFFKIIDTFEQMQTPYMLSRSIAMGVYVLPRATRDFDFVVHLQKKDVDEFISHFQEGYYCDKDAVMDAITRQSMFNIIDFESGYKAGFIVLKAANYRQVEFIRKKEVDYLGKKLYVVSAEDLVLSKLIWIQDIQSAQ
jgi:hypothetical protein